MRFPLRGEKCGYKPVALLLCLTILVLLYFAPRYLIISQTPEKSDTVILLISSDYRARFKEAQHLVHERYADYLIIPAFNQVRRAESARSVTKMGPQTARSTAVDKPSETMENTHVEVAQARRIMESLGFTSAIFVSSPYHMRRIKIIAERIFPRGTSGARLCFVPTRYQTPHVRLWFLHSSDLKFVVTEYVKIAWFLVYAQFLNISSAPTPEAAQ
ncbi:MAG: YdcF family protein [Syntrophorhabdales bacterium]|jgi:hypothetical protein